MPEAIVRIAVLLSALGLELVLRPFFLARRGLVLRWRLRFMCRGWFGLRLGLGLWFRFMGWSWLRLRLGLGLWFWFMRYSWFRLRLGLSRWFWLVRWS